MPKMLNDGALEYEDGVPATEAQVGFFFTLEVYLLCTSEYVTLQHVG